MHDDTPMTADEQHDIELTAYALDELDADRRAAVDARLAEEPVLRGRLDKIRAGAADIGAAFAAETLPTAAPPPTLRSPWVRRGTAVAACLGLAAGSAWVIGRGMSLPEPQPSETVVSATRTTPTLTPADPPATDYKTPSISAAAPIAAVGSNKAHARSLIGEARQLQIEMNLPEATLKLNQALAMDPGNFTAELLKESLADAKTVTDYRDAKHPRRRAAFASQPISPTEVGYRAATGRNVAAGKQPNESLARLADSAATPGVGGSVELRFAAPTEAFSLALSSAETYAPLTDNPFRSPADAPLSTFSIDVDTASYANVRRMLEAGQLPPADAVRIEEFINTFDYGYAPPAADATDDLTAPFATHVDVTAAPWAPGHRLVRIGLKGKEIATDDRPAANLVFLLDVSGSMKSPTKLPLVKDGLRKLVAALRMDDRVAIVVYAGASGLALDSTSDHDAVLAAIDSLTPGGSTHGSAGIELAYDVATANFVDGGLNRVVLCTDGDFNVGITDRSRLKTLIQEKAATGTYLSVLGFGSGNLKDATMEELSNAGDGNYGYIDSPQEAERLLARQVNGTLMTIAKDVKIQVEFNPARVASYRLIGYANRMLKKEDFNNDKVDAGDIGSGHTVTALYEVVPAGVAPPTPAVDPLKYARPQPAAAPANDSDELLTVKLRYKAPDAPKEQGTSKLLAVPVTDGGDRFDAADADARFAAAVAGFGMLLRRSGHAGDLDLPRVAEIARAANAAFAGDPAERERRSAFVELVERAQTLAEPGDDRVSIPAPVSIPTPAPAD